MDREWLARSRDALAHRGPDDSAYHLHAQGGFGFRRLSIIDLSAAGRQPMSSADGRYWLVLNGEIYNYLELKSELGDYPFRSATDSEVALAAFIRWGPGCLPRFRGMFALLVWDSVTGRTFAARDRFGVKPLYYHKAADGRVLFASEPKAFAAAGITLTPDVNAWRQYLAFGLYEHGERTFFNEIRSLPAGHMASVDAGGFRLERWYDLPARVAARYPDMRPDADVMDEYQALLEDSIRLRFRSDVPVGFTLSGGLDSSLLFGLVRHTLAAGSEMRAFTFTCGDPLYDESVWVDRLLAGANRHWEVCHLDVAAVPDLAARVAAAQDEPFGGVPTLAASLMYERAREHGVTVLLDGQGMDEQWAGYDYYARAADGESDTPTVQGTAFPIDARDWLAPEFFDGRAQVADRFPAFTGVPLIDVRLRDILHTKIPRALRFNDRISMMHSTELREPFLDDRLVELALAQPATRLIRNGERKVLLRRLAERYIGTQLSAAPKRPVQTPQREWLGGPLASWVREISDRSALLQQWYKPGAVDALLRRLASGETDNSFAVWQVVSVALWESTVLNANPPR